MVGRTFYELTTTYCEVEWVIFAKAYLYVCNKYICILKYISLALFKPCTFQCS